MVTLEAVAGIRAILGIVGVLNILFLAMENFIPSNAAKHYSSQRVQGLQTYIKNVAPDWWLNYFS